MKVGDLVTWAWSDDQHDVGIITKLDNNYAFVHWSWGLNEKLYACDLVVLNGNR